MRFLNQKLGKRTSRKVDLAKARLVAERLPKAGREKAVTSDQWRVTSKKAVASEVEKVTSE